MRYRRTVLGAAFVGCALAVAAPAGAAPKAEPPPAAVDVHVEHATKITTVRQILAYGRQNTWAAGVKLTERGGAYVGRAVRLRAKVGDWTCQAGYARAHGESVEIALQSMGGATCDARKAAVTGVMLRSHGSRLVTDKGSVRVGQSWKTAPRHLRAQVTHVARANRWEGGGMILSIGRSQDPCDPQRPNTTDSSASSPAHVGVASSGRVEFVGVNPGILEGISCDLR